MNLPLHHSSTRPAHLPEHGTWTGVQKGLRARGDLDTTEALRKPFESIRLAERLETMDEDKKEERRADAGPAMFPHSVVKCLSMVDIVCAAIRSTLPSQLSTTIKQWPTSYRHSPTL